MYQEALKRLIIQGIIGFVIAEMNNSEDQRLRRNGDKKIHAINVGSCMPWINYEPRTLKEIFQRWGYDEE